MTTSATATPVILDCDPGHDDAVAILLAVGSPRIDLLGVTTVFGNCAVENATRNALDVLALAGREEVPVAAGAAEPLQGAAVLGNYVHGASGLDGPALRRSTASPVSTDAVAWMADAITESDRPVTLVATGPITNVARLINARRDLHPKIAEVVFMGGSTERGNHTPYAEFNTYADPEALDVVLRSGIRARMVGLNLTHQALATPTVVERMWQLPRDLGEVVASWMGFFGGSYRKIWNFSSPPVHDPCTIAVLIDPSLIVWQHAFVAVETVGEFTRGATVVDLDQRWPQRPANAEVAMRLDADRYWDLVLAAIGQLVLQPHLW
ncbi:nucleoside hydrolase [Segeticoccus rhizosphaerae]|jgi:purine nucleosidase/pyrimidine-specific ribonucleoside hydrolase|uniref:nucleoside hydrolase n=1 Tax=Segeticoccus rhizosphaerae TaxID=1104777 RepID=UPI0012644392|nr:nucleoside hydrolase [Segeticoccus rhizosphaerae]